MASFVADAFALLELGGAKLNGQLDDEAMMLSITLSGERSFSVIGADYPRRTIVFGDDGEQVFEDLPLDQIVELLSVKAAPRPASQDPDTQPGVEEVAEPMVAVPKAEPLWKQHIQSAKVCFFFSFGFCGRAATEAVLSVLDSWPD
jgi:hypothetical protein